MLRRLLGMKAGINRDGQDEQDKEILDLKFEI
jgi:hypothetical protein